MKDNSRCFFFVLLGLFIVVSPITIPLYWLGRLMYRLHGGVQAKKSEQKGES